MKAELFISGDRDSDAFECCASHKTWLLFPCSPPPLAAGALLSISPWAGSRFRDAFPLLCQLCPVVSVAPSAAALQLSLHISTFFPRSHGYFFCFSGSVWRCLRQDPCVSTRHPCSLCCLPSCMNDSSRIKLARSQDNDMGLLSREFLLCVPRGTAHMQLPPLDHLAPPTVLLWVCNGQTLFSSGHLF